MSVAFSVGAIARVLSVLVGVTAAFLGGVWDEVLSLLTNVFLVIPALPLLIVLLGYLSAQGQLSTIIVLAFLGWPWGARVIRAQTLTIRNSDFIAASRESGEKTWRIIVFEIIPNEISLIVANFVNTVLYAIGASVALAFAGIANLESFSLGTILYWAQANNALEGGNWWWFLRRAWRSRSSARPWCCSTRDRRARQPAAARLARLGEDRRAARLDHRPDPGTSAAHREPQPVRHVRALVLALLAARRDPSWR